jgi:hypothetical protein
LELYECEEVGRHEFESIIIPFGRQSISGLCEGVVNDYLSGRFADDVILVVKELRYLIVKLNGSFLL